MVRSSDETPSTAVCRAVAEKLGERPTELNPRLGDVVDTDAVDRLFDRDRGTAESETWLRFEFHGYTVSLCSDGTVDVEE